MKTIFNAKGRMEVKLGKNHVTFKHKIAKMPSKKMLEKFLDSMGGRAQVYFDLEKGEFIENSNNKEYYHTVR
jgi:hypothetical protein